MKTIYISGPMTGHPDWNYLAFHKAAEWAVENGWLPINPAERFSGRQDLPRQTYMRMDLADLLQCDAILMLPGWLFSKGAKLEYDIAKELGLEVVLDYAG